MTPSQHTSSRHITRNLDTYLVVSGILDLVLISEMAAIGAPMCDIIRGQESIAQLEEGGTTTNVLANIATDAE